MLTALMVMAPLGAWAQTYEYDRAGRLTIVRYDDGSTMSYEYDANGNITRMGSVVASVDGSVAVANALRVDVQPNPATSATTITYRLPGMARVAVTIADALGVVVARRELGLRPAGEHAIVWEPLAGDGEALPAGLYVVAVECRRDDAPAQRSATKLVLSR